MNGMEELAVLATFLLPIILAVVEVIKRSVNVKVTYIPLIAIVLGIVLGLVSQPFTDLDMVMRLWAGFFAGLSATGTFELIKKREGTTKGGE